MYEPYCLATIAACVALIFAGAWAFLRHQKNLARKNLAKRLLLFGIRSSGQSRHRFLATWQDAMDFIGFKVKLRESNGTMIAHGRDANAAAIWIMYVQNCGDNGDFDESVEGITQMIKNATAIANA